MRLSAKIKFDETEQVYVKPIKRGMTFNRSCRKVDWSEGNIMMVIPPGARASTYLKYQGFNLKKLKQDALDHMDSVRPNAMRYAIRLKRGGNIIATHEKMRFHKINYDLILELLKESDLRRKATEKSSWTLYKIDDDGNICFNQQEIMSALDEESSN